MSFHVRVLSAIVWLTAVSPATAGQQAVSPPASAVTLGELERAAIAADPRSAQFMLLDRQSALREQSLQGSRRPTLGFDVMTQYQTDVAQPPLKLPSGAPLFSALHATNDASLRIDQLLLEPARQPQISLERAQLAERRAALRTALFSLRRQVREAFFGAYAIRERMAVLGISLTTLLRNREEAEARLIAGTAVPADVAEADAALLDLRQENESLLSQMRGLLQRLEMLTRRSEILGPALAAPDVEEAIARSLAATGARARPEFAQFSQTRTRLSRQLELVDAQQRPRVSAFGRVGYGRPGLNVIGDRFDAYGIVGLQVQWRPFTWGSADLDRDALRIQQQIVEADEAAFMNDLQALMPTYVYPLQRLEQAVVEDDRIIALREQVERTASARLQAGVITMSEYLARNAELMRARSARAARRVELAQKAAEMLEVAGVEIP